MYSIFRLPFSSADTMYTALSQLSQMRMAPIGIFSVTSAILNMVLIPIHEVCDTVSHAPRWRDVEESLAASEKGSAAPGASCIHTHDVFYEESFQRLADFWRPTIDFHLCYEYMRPAFQIEADDD